MARTARKHSDSGVYHVILRGVNKQQIFECTEDYQRFLNILRTLTVREQDESGHRSKYGRISNLIAEPLAEEEEEGLLDIEETPVKTCYSDEEIWHVLTNLCGMTTAAEFQQLPRPQQKHYLWEAHAKGIGPRALSRLTGVPYSIVQRATSAENDKRLQAGMVCESTLEDEDWYSYCSPDEFEPYPEY